jgi:GNAT superfamily N-acetyltransferase
MPFCAVTFRQLQPAHALPDVRSHRVLPDGSEMIVRTVQPSDAALLAKGFRALGADSRYQRFFAPKSTLSTDELRALTALDSDTHYAIGVTSLNPDGEEVPLGVARYVRASRADPGAEVAITVVDAAQGRGLGRMLLGTLIDAARARGVQFFRAQVLADNRAIHALLRSFDPDLRVVRRGDGAEELELSLAPSAELDSAPAPYGFARRRLRGALAWS